MWFDRLNLIKGPDLLLEAFAILRNELPHFLFFAGPDGGMKSGLMARVLALGLADRVRWLGHLERISRVPCTPRFALQPSERRRRDSKA